MRFCNACKTTYPPGISVCPRDGQATVSLSQQGEGDDPAIGKFAGSYRLLRKLGAGGMGSVYLAEHPTLRKRAAVKLLHAEFAQKSIVIERFFAEARAVSEIGHQNIVDILDFGVIEGLNLPFMLMEFLDGCSLQELLRRQKKLEPRLAVNITLQLLSALSAAHNRNIIHRDLKPDNVYLIERGEEINYVKLFRLWRREAAELAGDEPHASGLAGRDPSIHVSGSRPRAGARTTSTFGPTCTRSE